MSFELSNINEIEVQTGVINFNQYEQLKAQAIELAEYINNVEVNEDNIKTSKKLLAAVNKSVKEIEDKRISIKREMLAPYSDFEAQVKEIVSIVKDADATVREQVKELEEHERNLKRITIEEIFNKRVQHYFFKEVFHFDHFLKPQHLNKSLSITSVENEMIEWLERIESEILVIQSLANSEAILTEYYDTKDLTTAIRIVNEREALKNKIVEFVAPKQEGQRQVQRQKQTIITFDSDVNIDIIETFLRFNNIKYSIEKVEI